VNCPITPFSSAAAAAAARLLLLLLLLLHGVRIHVSPGLDNRALQNSSYKLQHLRSPCEWTETHNVHIKNNLGTEKFH
jgi:hypothetical protein